MTPVFHMLLACDLIWKIICLIRLLHLYVGCGLIHLFFNGKRKSFQYLLRLLRRLLSNVWAHVGDRLPPVECARTCCLRFTPIEFAWINKKKIGLSVVFDLSRIVKMPRLTVCIWILWNEFQYSALLLLHFFIWHPSWADICQRRRCFLSVALNSVASLSGNCRHSATETQKQMVMKCTAP